jgi:hypothetical protein
LLTCQVTAVFVVPVTVAVNAWDALAGTLAVEGLTATVTAGGGVELELPPHPTIRKQAEKTNRAR